MEESDAYAPTLKITFVQGRPPELFLRDDEGQELEPKIDLSGLTTEEIHALMAAKGIHKSVATEPAPTHSEEL